MTEKGGFLSRLQQKSESVMIVGLPNTGKTQTFNTITGEYNIVANYPSTTIEVHSAKRTLNNKPYTIIDTPGLHGLYIHSEEELAVRNMIIRKKPDIMLQCIDANRIKQSLYLTADLLELGIPLVISLNAIDETIKRGKRIDSKELSALLGVPVIETSATEGRGASVLRKAIERARVSPVEINQHESIEKRIGELLNLLPEETPFRRTAANLLLQNDPYIALNTDWIPEGVDRDRLLELVKQLRASFHGSINRAVNHKRNRWVDSIESRIMQRGGERSGFVTEWLASVSRRPATGIPILIGILIVGYLSVVHVAGALESLLSRFMTGPITGALGSVLADGFWKDFLLGDYGVLTLGLFNAIGTVLPVLTVFFLLFGILEDVGYLPNLAILVKRVLNRIGLTGKSIMPLVLGFGCKTMATLTTRSIPSRKEKLIAIYLIAFGIPCSAQLGLNMAILGNAGIAAFLIVIVFLFLVEILAGYFLNKIINTDQQTNFIQELPNFRLPNVKALLKKTYYRLLWFLKESILIFIIAAVVLFFLDWGGILDALKTVLSPIVVGWLGLPLKMVDALILTMARHEVAAGIILNMSDAGMLNFTQSVVAVVITTMFIPCIANIVAMFKELRIPEAIIMTLSINVSSFILAGILRWLLVALGG